ncbi:MAG: peptidoglycan DD-metalloendopeptidase family protein [Bacteroidales bacterium]|nr:peptidoglycan DD-metalloendopeptidase family protein [Bacteroidales bacterium]
MKRSWLRLVFPIIFLLVIIAGVIITTTTSVDPEEEITESLPKSVYHLNIDTLDIVYGEVRKNQNLSEILAPLVSMQTIDLISRTTRQIFDVRKIRPGNRYAVISARDSNKTSVYFIYEITATDFVVYDFRDSLRVYRDKKIVKKILRSASGTITSSLWNAFVDNGLDINLALKMSDVYAWTIDFYGVQKGDNFSVIYEELIIDTIPVGVGNILASRFVSAGNNFYAFYFEQDSVGTYFDELAESLQRTFLKAPLRFSRISSRFTNARKHPVLKIYRPHHGVDYAAPRGTPVVALGDGKVLEARWNGGFGRYIKIRHNSVYSTGYGHLSGYAKGIKSGKYVRQGDVIGYVGSSGLSTGPHLDFRVFKNNSPVDPLKMESPPAEPVDTANLKVFNALVQQMMVKLDSVR